MRETFGAKGGFWVDMSTLPRAPVGSLSHRLLRNWAALLSVRQARRRLSIPENPSRRGLDLWERIPREYFFFPQSFWTDRVFPPLQLFYSFFSFSFFTSSSYQHKFCDIILATFRSVRMRRLKWITWMWLRDRLLPLRHSHSFSAAAWKKTDRFLYGQTDGRNSDSKNKSKHRDLEFCKYMIFAPLFFFFLFPPRPVLSLPLLRFHDAEVKADSASRTGRERRQVRFGVSGCAERPEPVD